MPWVPNPKYCHERRASDWKTRREKVEGCDGIPGCGMEDLQTPDLVDTLTEASGVEKFE